MPSFPQEPDKPIKASSKILFQAEAFQLDLVINKLIADLQIAPDLTNLLSVLVDCTQSIKGFVAIPDENGKTTGTQYWYQGYQIYIGYKNQWDGLVHYLKMLNNLSISAAPTLLFYATIGKEETLLITYRNGCQQEPPLPFEQHHHRLSADAKTTFYQEMVLLSQLGLMHDDAPESREHWFINPSTGGILLDYWEHLVLVNNEERAEDLSYIKELLE